MGASNRAIDRRDRREPGSTTAAGGSASVEVRAVDDLVEVIVDRLGELGWTRDELAARAELNAASLRRLLTSPSANPTFATTMSIAQALGLRIEIREDVPIEQLRAG